MLDIKIPDPPTSPSLISLNGFCGRKAPCFQLHAVFDQGIDSGSRNVSAGIVTVEQQALGSKVYLALPANGAVQVSRGIPRRRAKAVRIHFQGDDKRSGTGLTGLGVILISSTQLYQQSLYSAV